MQIIYSIGQSVQYLTVSAKSTIESVLSSQNIDPAAYTVLLNSKEASMSTVLNANDRLSLTKKDLKGA